MKFDLNPAMIIFVAGLFFMRPIIIVLFPIIVGLAAQLSIEIPLSTIDIPISGQTLAILSFAMLVKPNEALIGMVLYILLGIGGLPVFSDLGSGWSAFSGNSLGYFIGFVLASFLVSKWSQQINSIGFSKALLISLAGTALILFCGFVGLVFRIGVVDSYKYGVQPFLIGGLFKILLGAIIVIIVDRYLLINKFRYE